MKSNKFFTCLMLALITASFTVNYAQETPAAVKNLAPKLQKWASSIEITSAVKAQNAKNVSLNKIKEIDKKWMETSGVDKFMKDILSSNCSEYLKKLRKENPFIVEAFVMDNKGANVAMTNKTSDYWQGDEDKFIKSYNNGNGTLHFGKLSFDESSQAYVIQVSVPVIEKGKTIGAVTFGVDSGRVK